MASNFLSLNPAKTEFLLIGLPAQLAKIHNPTLTIPSNTTIQPVSSVGNLGVIFYSNLSVSDHISYILKSCFSHIRDLRRRILSTLDHKTACTVATSLIHSKLDYCNSLSQHHQLNRLQLVLNSAARAVTKTPKFHHSAPHLKSLHWLKITQRIQYKILSLTYKSLQYNNLPPFLVFSPYSQLVLPAQSLICSCHSPMRVCQNCYYQLRQIRRIKRSLTANSITLLVLASVHSRLDYCNSVLYSLPWSRLQLLQSVLNSVARLI